MRVAFAGKGGAGKTTIAATVARLSARAGRQVVAIDADSNPNLVVALGIRNTVAEIPNLPASLVSRRLDRPGFLVPLDDLLSEHCIVGPDGIQLIAMGTPDHADQGCLCSAHAVISVLLGALGERPDIVTLVDMEASPEHLSRGTVRNTDVLLLVAEPYYRALEAVGRLARLASELPIDRVAVVANKVRSGADADAISAYCERHNLEQVASVEWCDDVLAADRAGGSLIDAAPDSVAVRAIDGLLATIGVG